MKSTASLFADTSKYAADLDWIIHSPSLFIDPIVLNVGNLNGIHFQPFISGSYGLSNRLGFYYQWLWKQVIEQSAHYDLIAEEVQINHEGRTIGAIDFILREHATQQLEHWEIAVKFYLFYQGQWLGPNNSDRLDLKIDKMLNHQLTLTSSDAFIAQTCYTEAIKPKMLVQGRLYTNPFLEERLPSHCCGLALNKKTITGQWCFEHQYPLINEPLYLLDKSQWMSGKPSLSEKPFEIGKISRTVHLQSESGVFWFIVPNEWININ
ncbi:DUF1853 family protein [Aliivibrio kagoshimensis]|uniref:DUF1853 family protein n=1 Tax=Aliivibrio kagoshimensis TaxID=2910230 RepID=UPI003D0E43F2